jgi:hypothetical protein
MVVAKLHRINFGRGTIGMILTDEPVEKALNRFLLTRRYLKVEWIEWIETTEVPLTANKPSTAAHELTRYL